MGKIKGNNTIIFKDYVVPSPQYTRKRSNAGLVTRGRWRERQLNIATTLNLDTVVAS